MEVSFQLHAPAALHTGKEPSYPLDKTLGGPQSRSARCRVEIIVRNFTVQANEHIFLT
jgi:hypothetical protein